MEMFLDCLPCTLRQALEVSKLTTDDPGLREKIMTETIKIITNFKNYRCSPEMARDVHRKVKELTGLDDPYQSVKAKDIKAAKNAYPFIRDFLKSKGDTLHWALKVSATGNIIDSAIYGKVNIEECIEGELEKDFSVCDLDQLERKLNTAKTLLIIGDNAGETVFDRLLIEHLSHLDITYAVRSEPIINDATIKDAYESGLGEVARIISSGCSNPGTILEECSDEFINILDTADIVISKGQGNYETLNGYGKKIFYLLKAKCDIVAEKLNVKLNDYVFKYFG